MRIIHTSDWHLGQYFYGKSRANEHQQFLTWLLEQIEQHHVDAVIVAGDIFDTGTPPSYAREMYFDFIAQISKLNCSLIMLAGNHDSVAMLNESKQVLASLSVQVIASAEPDNITQQVITIKNSEGEPQALLCAIPFIRPRDVIKSKEGQSSDDKKQYLQQAISDYYQQSFDYAKKIKTNLNNQNIPIIATGHLTTVGVTTSDSVRDIYIGTLEAFPANAFPEADYIALGHIHKPQKVAKSEHIRYCGSPIPLSFDEAKQHKQVLMVDFEYGKLTKVTGVVVPRFQAMAMVKTNLDNLVADVKQLVSEQESLLSENLTAEKSKLWLDIEIESADYLNDLHQQIVQLTQDLPIEILLIRRSKKARQQMNSSTDKTVLTELTLDEVFAKRLELETWQTEQQQAQEQRLTSLFKTVVNELESSIKSINMEQKE
jgi:exonuclease SbcD